MSSNNGQSTSGRSTSGDTTDDRQARLDSTYRKLTGEDPSERASDAPSSGSYRLPSYYTGDTGDASQASRDTTGTTGSGPISEAERKQQLDATMQKLTGDATSRYSAGGTATTPRQSGTSADSSQTLHFQLSPGTAAAIEKEREEREK